MDVAVPTAADVLKLIKDRFAGREELIERAFRHDVTFRSLCKDYRDCYKALARLRRDDLASAAQRRAEYAELLDELGCEIRGWLETQDIR
jgi:hypothetical protein